MAELDPQRGVAVWLVEAKAVRIGDSKWAPLFSAVVEPNAFTMNVELAKQSEATGTLEQFWTQFVPPDAADTVKAILARWSEAGHRRRLGPNHIVLEARGPSISGVRTVVAIYADGPSGTALAVLLASGCPIVQIDVFCANVGRTSVACLVTG